MTVIDAEIRTGFELLRSVFAGIAARHDRAMSRLVIAEDGYREFLRGPRDSDFSEENMIAGHGFTIREPSARQITAEERDQIVADNPEAKVGQSGDGHVLVHLQPGVHSQMVFSGDIPSFGQFQSAAHDAGFFLITFLHNRRVELKLPELVPLGAVTSVPTRSGSTNLPSSLFERWVLFLHILGWQAPQHAPLRAQRALWHENFRLLVDPEEMHRFVGETPLSEKLASIPIPPKYFASNLFGDLSVASVYAIDGLLTGRIDTPLVNVEDLRQRLAAIRPGNEGASAYHALVAEILSAVVEPDLDEPISEEKYHEGRGRIDIVFRNSAERGYFADLLFRHHLKCPVVFFECKNYSSDIGSEEFAQLSSRFSAKRSKVGFIVCRTIDNKELVHQRCKDRFSANDEHIVVLEDSDLIALLDAKDAGDSIGVSRLLHAKWRPIFMDQ